MYILVLNSGSSSQKSCVYEIAEALPASPPAPIWEGKIEWEGSTAILRIRGADGQAQTEQVKSAERADATRRLLDALTTGPHSALKNRSEIDVVGHRIVNGGREFSQPSVINADVKASIEKMAVFAPLHNRIELEGIRMIEQALGPVPQVAVFDTGFHRRIPDAAAIYPGPYAWAERGIRRYGFHGINHQYCAERTVQLLRKKVDDLRLVTCHLGNGCSLAAVRDAHSVDTTMGFTPLDGLMMGTRSGSVDPGILTFLMREQNLTGEQLDEVLNKKSGLLGISGVSSDMRQIIQAMKQGDARAKLAFDIFVHRLRTGIASMVASLGGMDALVFSAGIGENSPEVRAAACTNLAFLGLMLDPVRNQSSRGDEEISTQESKVRVLVLRAQEDWAIAKECWRLQRGSERASAT
jgi:acetate kinase